MYQFVHDFLFDKETFCFTVLVLAGCCVFGVAMYQLSKSNLG